MFSTICVCPGNRLVSFYTVMRAMYGVRVLAGLPPGYYPVRMVVTGAWIDAGENFQLQITFTNMTPPGTSFVINGAITTPDETYTMAPDILTIQLVGAVTVSEANYSSLSLNATAVIPTVAGVPEEEPESVAGTFVVDSQEFHLGDLVFTF